MNTYRRNPSDDAAGLASAGAEAGVEAGASAGVESGVEAGGEAGANAGVIFCAFPFKHACAELELLTYS